MAEYLIWQNYDLDLDDWREDLLEEEPGLSEHELYERMVETNDEYLCVERANLNIQLARDIIAIVDIGRWNGRFNGYKYIRSGNIRDCLHMSKDCEYAKWYVDEDGDLHCRESHHDASNYLRYRVIRDDATDEQIEELEDAILDDSVTEELICAVTLPIGEHIAKVYGWDLSGNAA